MKVFVGGLAWETSKEGMRVHFERFSEILEAVVIADKGTGRSKGSRFMILLVDAMPEWILGKLRSGGGGGHQDMVNDVQRANCNLAYLGIQRSKAPQPTASASIFWYSFDC
ncbi:probable RNA-binding protein ARP1 [Aegilops tauschii subsp. strangulata]|uniref:probable RNA-binding protein ARP1 n=1 Tax=Aegilops tauschii subsp. strangulata TaxID=200361 RepID=UPI003CC8B879